LVLGEFSKERGLSADQRLAGFGSNGFVGVQAAIAANVQHGMASLGEYTPNQQAAMAMGRVLFAAKQGDAIALDAGLKAGERFLEARFLAEMAIENVTSGVVALRVCRSAAEFRTQVEITEARLFQRALKMFPVILRRKFRIGRGAKIDHDLNLMLAQKVKPDIKVMLGVAESEKATHARNSCQGE
jgi:hypothetical protein